MDYRVVADSSCEPASEITDALNLDIVPFSMLVEGVNYVDDKNIDVKRFVDAMKASKFIPKSACPSPDMFLEKFALAANSFAITISAKLSGCYSSAVIACKMFMESHPDSRVHVFDSQSASAGEVAIALKIKECLDAHMDFDSIVTKVSAFISDMKTFFICENLDNLIKNGRMNRIVGYVASVMSIRPIMTAVEGEIKLFEKARGSVRAVTRLVDIIGECRSSFADRTLVITHCNNENQAHFIRSEAQRRYDFKSICVTPTRGLSSMYVNDGGVIIAF